MTTATSTQTDLFAWAREVEQEAKAGGPEALAR
jgi:hypothetical protein